MNNVALIVAGLMGLSVGHFSTPTTPMDAPTQASYDSATAAMNAAPVTTLHLANASNRSDEVNATIAAKVEEASIQMETALSQAPAVASGMATSISQHGVVRAILYDDPQVQGPLAAFGQSIGKGLAALATAVQQDMIYGAQHPNGRGG